ncbi:hypothetical protein [Dongia sp.]|uniref:hypothetical protein n=1 Tax=Dongia sp. TaxID=1977262 RepID=UPI0035B0795B
MTIVLQGRTPIDATLLIDRPQNTDVFVGQADFNVEWLKSEGFDIANSTDNTLLRSISTSDRSGKLLHIPLSRRHAYNLATDGHWQYVPLQADVFGELILQIGAADIPAAEKLAGP